MASKAIRFTKAEMEAVGAWLKLEHEMQDGAHPDFDKNRLKAGESLWSKMKAASLSTSPASASPSDVPIVRTFVEVFGDRLVWPVTGHRWGMLKKTLVEAKWTEAEMRELDLSWATRPIPAVTVAAQGKEWLAAKRHPKTKAAPAMFHLPQEDDE